MTPEPVIRLKNIDLYYSSYAFRDNSLKGFVLKTLTRKNIKPIHDIHALKHLTFDIRRGERVALLGHNGAGKTTLLKALAGLYPINSGTMEVLGEIRSLLEISLGFEPESTGRENILYRGLLLGKSPRQMKDLESEIVDFADIGDFIDYPVKTYSAGMQVRLAFAISTAIPGDILLLDEVIGAGDASFMVKAQTRITELIAQANIMILASHDFSSVRKLCNRAIVLDHGFLMFDGSVEEGIAVAQRMQGLSNNAV
jgi:lipopolysaccharide transport system ATP-binding protein